MESTLEQNQCSQEKVLLSWLKSVCSFPILSLEKMPGDASFRSYYRLYTNTSSMVVMAAPPNENTKAFVAIANALRQRGLVTPDIIEKDMDKGFLLITDLGKTTYLQALNASNMTNLYGQALQALGVMQGCHDIQDYTLPLFDQAFMWKEWLWHKEWFAHAFLKLTMGDREKELDHCMSLVIHTCLHQPQVFMHRDYHSANLMVLEKGGVGLLDFQDAFLGPITYDLVSLLKDCYITCSSQLITQLVSNYYRELKKLKVLPDVSEKEFLRWFDWMGVQRHLKALLTFARKKVRDHQPYYLQYIPRTLTYLLEVTFRYPELYPLYHYLNQDVLVACIKRESLCVR